MRGCLRWGACAALLAACSGPLPELEPLPEAGLGALSPQVAERLDPLLDSLRSSPHDAAAAGKAGMLLLAYGQYGPAIGFLERARAVSPSELRWAYYLGISLAKLGMHEQAAVAFRRCLAIDGEFIPAKRRLAEAAFETNDLQASLNTFRELLQAAPDDPRILYGAGRAAAAAGDADAAMAHLTRAVKLTPVYGDAHYALALLYRDLGLASESANHMEAFERNRNREPPISDPLLEAALGLRITAAEFLKQGVEAKEAGRVESSIQLHLKALDEDPSLLQARVNLLILFGSQGEHAAAEEQYRLALEAGNETAELHYNYGVLAYRRGMADEAGKAFQRALAINPEHALANHNLGQVLEEQGRFGEAMELYRRAIENRPDHGLSHYKMGLLWMRERDAPKAVRAFLEAAKEQSDRTPTYLFSLAAAELAAGERATATARFRKARGEAVRYSQPELVRRIDETLKTLGSGSALP